jgi:hypothetical protein
MSAFSTCCPLRRPGVTCGPPIHSAAPREKQKAVIARANIVGLPVNEPLQIRFKAPVLQHYIYGWKIEPGPWRPATTFLEDRQQ